MRSLNLLEIKYVAGGKNQNDTKVGKNNPPPPKPVYVPNKNNLISAVAGGAIAGGLAGAAGGPLGAAGGAVGGAAMAGATVAFNDALEINSAIAKQKSK